MMGIDSQEIRLGQAGSHTFLAKRVRRPLGLWEVEGPVDEEQRAVVLSAGCDDFVRKPFREEEIFETMARHLGLKYIYEEPLNQT